MPEELKFPEGNESGHSKIRKSRIRTYQYKLDIRGTMGRWNGATERGGTLVKSTRDSLLRQLAVHKVFKGHRCLEALKRATTEDQLEAALDQVWLQAESRNLVLLA